MGCGCNKNMGTRDTGRPRATADQMRRARRTGQPLPDDVPALVTQGDIRFRFMHGLDDVAAFTMVASSYLSRGWRMTVDVTPYSAHLWRAVGATVVDDATLQAHPYNHGPDNKIRHNIGLAPMPPIDVAEVWSEITTRHPVSLSPWLSPEGRAAVEEVVGDQAPVVIHDKAHTWHSAKELPPELTAEVVELLRQAGHRVIILGKDFATNDVVTLWHLLDRAAGIIAIGSGVQLLASHWTRTPVLGVWHQHSPATFAVPRANTRHLVRTGLVGLEEYSVVEYAGEMPRAEAVVASASEWFKFALTP